jgi:hypothetical protein
MCVCVRACVKCVINFTYNSTQNTKLLLRAEKMLMHSVTNTLSVKLSGLLMGMLSLPVKLLMTEYIYFSLSSVFSVFYMLVPLPAIELWSLEH